MLSVPRLLLLREVAARGTIAAAAEAVAYTASAVSQQLAKLETEVGAPLLERHGRGVALTELGRIAVEHADEIFKSLDRAEAAIDVAKGTIVGRVGIASFSSGITELVTPAARRLRDSAPNLQVEVSQLEDNDSITELRLGTADIALLQEYTNAPTRRTAGLSSHSLLDDPLMLAVPAAWDERSVNSLAAYRDEIWIAEPADTAAGQALDYAARTAEFTPDIRYRVVDFRTTRALVAAGLGVALIPRLAATDMTHGVRLVALRQQKMKRHIYAATRHEEVQRPTVRVTLDALREAAGAIERAST